MFDNRLEQQLAFCELHGWQNADLYPLPSDASFRTYTRLVDGNRCAMLMDAPPEKENLPAYLKFAAHLDRLGFKTPEIYASDTRVGLALIEDFGNDTFTRLLQNGADEEVLYLQAVDVLIALHKNSESTDVVAPPYDEDLLLTEVMRFVDWFVPAVRGADVTEEEAERYRSAWAGCLVDVAVDRSALVVRDFHVDNLMILKGGSGIASCGLLDFQDALLGSPAYDMASLLQDARRDIKPQTKSSVLARYFGAMPEIDRKKFEIEMAILGAQRHTKVLGMFTRLSRRDSKHIYLKYIPRVARLLQECLQVPELSAVREVIEQLVPDYADAEILERD